MVLECDFLISIANYTRTALMANVSIRGRYLVKGKQRGYTEVATKRAKVVRRRRLSSSAFKERQVRCYIADFL